MDPDNANLDASQSGYPPPTLSDGRTLRTGSAQSRLRFLRRPSVRLDRLRWYKRSRLCSPPDVRYCNSRERTCNNRKRMN